jgi:hypothetical protein
MHTIRNRLFALSLSATAILFISFVEVIFAGNTVRGSYSRPFSELLPHGFAHLDLIAKWPIYASAAGYPRST